MARQQGETERTRVQLRQWVEPARYLVIGAAVVYLVVLIAAVVVVPDLVIGVVFAGVGALLGVAVGTAATIYVREATSLVCVMLVNFTCNVACPALTALASLRKLVY